MKTFGKIALLLGGVILFAWYLSRADLPAVGAALARLGWLAPVALVPYLVVYVVDCAGWRLCLPAGLRVPFFTLFRIRWAGESVNNVLPSAYVGGEAVKVHLLRKRGVPAASGASSAVVSKSAQSVAQLFFILLAALALLRLGVNQPGLRLAMALVLGGGAVALAVIFWIQRRGVFACLLGVARTLRFKFTFLENRRAKILEVDRAITGFYRDHRPRFYAATGLYLGGWLLDTLELFLVAYLLGLPITWPQALAVEAFTSVAKVIGMGVPGALGVQESGIVLLGRLAGLPETLGVAYALLRRAREVIFAAIGWALLYGEHATLRAIRMETTPSPSNET